MNRSCFGFPNATHKMSASDRGDVVEDLVVDRRRVGDAGPGVDRDRRVRSTAAANSAVGAIGHEGDEPNTWIRHPVD